MISRRNIRVKVMQSLYVLDSINGDLKPGQAVNLLKKQIIEDLDRGNVFKCNIEKNK